MDNFFISQYFSWAQPDPSSKVKVVNSILKYLGFWVRLAPPTSTGGMTNVEQRMNLYHFVSQVLAYGIPGEFVELGCNQGETSVLITKLLYQYGSDRKLHVYDSFQGLPKGDAIDGVVYKEGDMATNREVLLKNFAHYGLDAPVIHEGWFEATLPKLLPLEIAFAHLDGDFYSSIKTSLEYVYPRLVPGAICVIDDYCDPEVYRGWNFLPGVKQACDEYLADKPERVAQVFAGSLPHGFFRKGECAKDR